MKKMFLSFILLLLFSVLNIEATNIVVKTDKQFLTNSSIAKKVANKEKIDKKKNVFDKNLNVALLTDEELKQLINDALLNCNNAELMELGTKLGIAQKYDWTPIISSAVLARAKCDYKKAQSKCNYALDCYWKEYLKGDISDKTKKILYETVDGINVGCQDWLTVCAMAATVPCAMEAATGNDNDFDKAWRMYEKAMLAVKVCKSFTPTRRKVTIDGVNSEISIAILEMTRHKNNKEIKLSLETAKKIKKVIEQLPTKDFTGGLEYKQNLLDGEIMRQNILKALQKHIDEKNNSR